MGRLRQILRQIMYFRLKAGCMKQVTILVTYGCNLSSVDNPRQGFLEANHWLEKQGHSPMFQVQLAGAEKEVQLENGMYTIRPDVLIQDVHHTDLVVIPASSGKPVRNVLEENKIFIPWIIHQYQQGAEIASLCLGAFLLAATGLLNGKACSTHWKAMHELEKYFPEVQCITDRILTDTQGIYTSGGAFSSANLILYLIEKYVGRAAAIYCAKMFQIDIDRSSQSAFIIFDGQKDHADDLIRKAQEYIEKHYTHKITVGHLCQIFSLSKRNFERRFKQATSNTVAAYIQRVRIEAAKKYLEQGRYNVNEVMYEVGYQDHKAFRKVFKKITGLSPLQYRNKYNLHGFTATDERVADGELN